MVYCGSGTETYEEQQTDACCDKILWSTAEAVLRHHFLFGFGSYFGFYGLLRKRY